MHSEDAQTPGDYETPELVLHGTIVEATEGGQQQNVSGGSGDEQEKFLPILGWVLDIL